MPYANLQIIITDPQSTAIITKIQELEALLPFVVNLATNEKRKGRRFGAKSIKLFTDALSTITLDPIYKPAFVNRDDFARDMDAYFLLQIYEQKLRTLTEAVSDTRLALALEMVPPTLAIYANVKNAALSNVPGSDAVLKKLQPYFKVERKKKK